MIRGAQVFGSGRGRDQRHPEGHVLSGLTEQSVQDPMAEEKAYSALGRLLVTWAAIDQTITRGLWRRDRSSAFPPPVPSHFPGRLILWGEEARRSWPADAPMTWEEFERHHAEALGVRNALAHWVVDVHGHAGRFSVAVHPHEPSGWRPAFDRWWRRVKNMPPMERHPGPASGRVTFSADQLGEVFLACHFFAADLLTRLPMPPAENQQGV